MKSVKIYKTKITIPNNVEIKKQKNELLVSGLLGSTLLSLENLDLKGVISFKLYDNVEKTIILSSSYKSFLKSISTLIQNKIIGVSSGFLVSIRIIGVGYRAEIVNQTKCQILLFKVGFSHDLKYIVPSSIRAFLLEPTLICLYGINKNQVTQVSAKIRQIKPPSVYKGKGIKLVDETVFIKAGKRK